MTGGFQERGKCLFIGLAVRSILSPTVFPFSSFILRVNVVEMELIALSQPCIANFLIVMIMIAKSHKSGHVGQGCSKN